ncbi:hypothetical protein EG68_06661 [Paragonimus skrjabini miyazakii]|uniref:Uncharacterized protein n=1 Tax=Paragonimus skrjabini miyazakii TaxID=59628 RepID=A0A8S9YZU8_9TREM|nr:hypothetical protein EG68_06661 [Paragonimus skrjabini miyazakii]
MIHITFDSSEVVKKRTASHGRFLPKIRLWAVLSIVLCLSQLKSGRCQSKSSTQMDSDDADPELEKSKAHIPTAEETLSLNEGLSEEQKMPSESARALNKNQSIFYFPLTSSLSLSEQLRSHIGSRRGTIGTEHVPVISPPRDVRVRSNHTKSYQKEDKVCEKRNIGEEHYITQKMLQFHAFVEALNEANATSQDPLTTLIHPFLTTLPEARAQFITHFCVQRQYFASVADYAVRNWALQPDYFQFCPKVCGKREGGGLHGDRRIMLNRYSKPCNHPSAYSTYVSRICVHPNTMEVIP